MKKIPLVVICGPTASGKTALGAALASFYGGEVVSADSMQIYKGMDIATAKPSVDEMLNVPHHLIGYVDSGVAYSVADYLAEARKTVGDIHSRGKLPFVVGGTGLYISSLVDNIKFDEIKSDGTVRKRLQDEAETLGNEAMLQRLYAIDEETAATLHSNNLPRIIRALEVYELTGVTMSEQRRRSRLEESPYNACIIGLDASDRDFLYDRINRRVDIMVHNGLIEEARSVYLESGGMKTASQAIGYKELIPFFNGERTAEECIDILKMETRRYAKRQLTWFRRIEGINTVFIDKYENYEKILESCKKIIANSEIMCYNKM